MTRGDRPIFSIITGTESAEDRRIVSTDTVRALTGITVTDVDDDTLNLRIDSALAAAARYCKLARAGAAPATFASEEVRAVWSDVSAFDFRWHNTWLPYGRTSLLLPWRVPITAIEVTESETILVEGVDYRVSGAGVVKRMSSGWPFGNITVDYTAGWIPDDDENPVPADLVDLIAQQVRLSVVQVGQDPTLRSEAVPGLWSGTYAVAGGDSISTSGLSRSLESALDSYRAPPSIG